MGNLAGGFILQVHAHALPHMHEPWHESASGCVWGVGKCQYLWVMSTYIRSFEDEVVHDNEE
jgi:hypothetical protein